MKYMLLIYGDESMAAQATPEQMQAQGEAYEVFTESIRKTDQYLDGDPFLATSEATTVEVRDGETKTTAGPAVTSSPQLTAYYKVEAGSPEEAIEMATRIPGAQYGSIEVRPVMAFD